MINSSSREEAGFDATSSFFKEKASIKFFLMFTLDMSDSVRNTVD